jgi:hypothetical protein
MHIRVRLVISTWDSHVSHQSPIRWLGVGFTPAAVVVVHPIPSFSIFIIEP